MGGGSARKRLSCHQLLVRIIFADLVLFHLINIKILRCKITDLPF